MSDIESRDAYQIPLVPYAEGLPDPLVHAAFNELLLARNSAGIDNDAWLSHSTPDGDALLVYAKGFLGSKKNPLPRKSMAINLTYDEAAGEALQVIVAKRRETEFGHQKSVMALTLFRNLPFEDQPAVSCSVTDYEKFLAAQEGLQDPQVAYQELLSPEILNDFVNAAHEPFAPAELPSANTSPAHEKPGLLRRFAGIVAARQR